MTDQPANQQDSYVNEYQPPTPPPPPPSSKQDGDGQLASPPPPPVRPAGSAQTENQTKDQTESMEDQTESMDTTNSQTSAQPNSASQTLEDQNIFFLLGVSDASDEEKEAFLDELQQVIWEDFIEHDAVLLITSEEQQGLQQIMNKGTSPEVQEEMIIYLEKLIPDLEEIMLEKALELKEDMVRERIAGMREYYVGQLEVLSQLNHAEQLINQNQWRQAAELLNSIENMSEKSAV